MKPNRWIAAGGLFFALVAGFALSSVDTLSLLDACGVIAAVGAAYFAGKASPGR